MSCCAMLLAVLLPVALAAPCTCPPSSPEDTSVCGSDGRTYSSECQLQCVDQPGLHAAHPGPCATPEVPASRHRRYGVKSLDWEKCHKESPQCRFPPDGSCKECGADVTKCGILCYFNCRCGCWGLPTGAAGLDEDSIHRFFKCYVERRCDSEECAKNCNTKACYDSCNAEWDTCSCGCVAVAAAGSTASPTTSTGPPPTASSTTSSSTDRIDHSVPVRALWEYAL